MPVVSYYRLNLTNAIKQEKHFMATNQARRSGYGQNKSVGNRAGATKTGGGFNKDDIPPTTHVLKLITGDNQSEFVEGSFLTVGENKFGTYLKVNIKNTLEPGTYIINTKKDYDGSLSV